MVEIPEQSQSDLRAVHELIAGGLLGEAESRCLRLLATSPHTDDLLQLLLQVYMTQHRTDAAVDVFAKLIARHPDDLHFYAHLADYLLGIGRPAEAIASYQRLLARQPQLADLAALGAMKLTREPFDFLTWFEFAPADEPAFDRLLARLRATREWDFVEREVDVRLVRTEPV